MFKVDPLLDNFFLDPNPDHIDACDPGTHTLQVIDLRTTRCTTCDHRIHPDGDIIPGRDCPDDCIDSNDRS